MKAKSTILKDIETIVETSEESQLGKKFMTTAAQPLENLSQWLGVNKTQATLFAIIANYSLDSSCSFGEVKDHLGIENLDMLRLLPDLRELQKAQLIKAKGSKDHELFWLNYFVPDYVLNNLMSGEQIEKPKIDDLDIETFILRLEKLFEEKRTDEIPYEQFVSEIHELIAANMQLDFACKLHHLHYGDYDLVFLLKFCIAYLTDQDESIGLHDLEDLLDGDKEAKSQFNGIRCGRHRLCKDRWVEPAGRHLFGGDTFKLTDHAKETLLPKELMQEPPINFNELVKPDSITEKSLFYAESDRAQIARLQGLLQPEAFRSIKQRMKAQNMRQGFACLLYGAPGTGKTETVLQMARTTGRAILQVNLAEMRSMWVGESEKKVKEVFDRYRNFVKHCDLEPILLFNEADGIISKRSTDATRAVDKMENTLQNIILQEMETLDGVMIATTNLTQNMDSAFERRFLYKINFHKPDFACRRQIWQSMLPDLSEHDATLLAERYDFSGGQMENITRKATVENLLTGQTPNLETLIEFCEEETIATSRPRIGF